MDIYATSFEDRFEYYDGVSELEVPPGWTPLWVQGDQPGINHRPEFKPEWDRVNNGKQAAKIFTTHASHDAVLARTVDVQSSALVTVIAHGATFKLMAGHALRVGIDPTGALAYPNEGIIWSDWWGQDNNDWEAEEYHRFEVSAMPQAGQVTVYLLSKSRFPAQTVASYWDDLTVVQAGTAPEPDGGDVDYERFRQIVREELDRTVWGVK